MNSERRKDCPMRHPDNGNCLPAGGFCTAVNNIICDALHSAHMRGYVAASEKYTEVVRCKDCKHWLPEELERCKALKQEPYGLCNRYPQRTDWHDTTDHDDFCSYGERR